jgi:hypothetical protein
MERVDLLARVRDEAMWTGPLVHGLAVRDDEVRELRAVLAPPRLQGFRAARVPSCRTRRSFGRPRTRMWTWSTTTLVQSQSIMCSSSQSENDSG